MYKYYVEVESPQHFLFGHEIAGYLMQYYGIVATSGKTATKMVEAILRELEQGNDKVYYNTRRGLCRVYPTGAAFLRRLCYSRTKGYQLNTAPGEYTTEEVEGKRWHYRVLPREELKP